MSTALKNLLKVLFVVELISVLIFGRQIIQESHREAQAIAAVLLGQQPGSTQQYTSPHHCHIPEVCAEFQ